MAKPGSPKKRKRLTAKQERIFTQISDFRAKNPEASEAEFKEAIFRLVAADAHDKGKMIGPGKEAYVDLFVSLAMESDRGCVLVAAAIMDEELESLLREHIAIQSDAPQKDVDFFFKDGAIPPLRSTALKIRLAFVLGLIPSWLHGSLLKVQSLRSRVAAHSRTMMRLKPEQVGKLLETLPSSERVKPSKDYPTTGPGRPFVISDKVDMQADPDTYSAKVMFCTTMSLLLADIVKARKALKRRRRPLHSQSRSGSSASKADEA